MDWWSKRRNRRRRRSKGWEERVRSKVIGWRERRQKRREKENDLMGWEDETPFPDDNAAADYIDANDILV